MRVGQKQRRRFNEPLLFAQLRSLLRLQPLRPASLFFFLAKTDTRRAGVPSYLLVGSDSFVFFVIRRLRAALPAGFWICLLPLFLYLYIRCIEILPTSVPLCLFLLASTCLSYSIHLIICSDLNLSLFPCSSSSSFH